MKRYTMTPISRKQQKLPSTGIRTPIKPRASIASENHLKRDVRTVRDINYKKACADNVYNFLSENNFEGGLSQKIISNPSNKDFQSMFKFIFSFIDDYEYSNKFEEDVISILKILKYPYSSEITKSQLSAITPHIWPILLSMLSWIVDLMLNVESCGDDLNKKQSVDKLFYDFVSNGYMKYLQGEEDDKNLEEEFEIKIEELYSDVNKDIENGENNLKILDIEINKLREGFSGVESIEKKKLEILEDLNNLIASQKQLENKKSKYLQTIKKINEDICTIEKEINSFKSIQEDLQNKISKQKMNPEDVQIMNKEKLDLYRELEKITPEKEKFMVKNKKLEKNLMEISEEIEKLIYDFNTFREDLNFKFEKNNNSFKFTRNPEEIRRILENEFSDKMQHIEELRINKDTMVLYKEDKESLLKNIENRIENSQSKLSDIGEIYLEKKRTSEEGQKKSKGQMDELERELMHLNLESKTALVQSEQSLQTARVNFDKITNKCKHEREMIKNLIYNFCNNIENYKNGLRRINDKLQNLQFVKK